MSPRISISKSLRQYKFVSSLSLSLMAIAVSSLISGCTSAGDKSPTVENANEQAQTNNSGQPNAVDSGALTAQGSDTMEGLMHKWAVNYMAAHSSLQVSVKDGDTGSGISDLLSGKIDLAAASREMTDAERDLARQKGVRFKREMVAKDAIAIIVNPANKIDSVVVSDLAKIYGGQILNWKQLDKTMPDEPIRVFGRETSSGTADYFQEHVLQGKTFDSSVKVMPSSEALMGAVMGNRLAIGFVGMAQATAENSQVKVLKLKLTSTSPAIEKNALLTGHDYPLSRPLYIYYNSANEAKVGKFVQYCLSAEGQKTVAEMGFLPARLK